MNDQANLIVSSLKVAGIDTKPNKEIIALIAYLQRLGTDIKKQPMLPANTLIPKTSALINQ
jgi:cytochrome c oxidase cbb3-type subunit I/II